jgi:ABC-2 type transport system ATP-binding protein
VSDGIIEAADLGVRFIKNRRRNLKVREFVVRSERRPRVDEFWALRGLTFTIKAGDAVGVVGRNGTGKSTLLRLIAGVLVPDEGTVATYGRVAPLLELNAGFTQDLTGRENVAMVAALHGLGRAEMVETMPKIIEFAGEQVHEFIDVPVRHYSSGMRVRLGFAIIAHLPHPILLVDEVLAVGDREFRQKCYSTIEGMLGEGRTLVLVSHSEPDLRRFCNRGFFINSGRLDVDGSVGDALAEYNSQQPT